MKRSRDQMEASSAVPPTATADDARPAKFTKVAHHDHSDGAERKADLGRTFREFRDCFCAPLVADDNNGDYQHDSLPLGLGVWADIKWPSPDSERQLIHDVCEAIADIMWAWFTAERRMVLGQAPLLVDDYVDKRPVPVPTTSLTLVMETLLADQKTDADHSKRTQHDRFRRQRLLHLVSVLLRQPSWLRDHGGDPEDLALVFRKHELLRTCLASTEEDKKQRQATATASVLLLPVCSPKSLFGAGAGDCTEKPPIAQELTIASVMRVLRDFGLYSDGWLFERMGAAYKRSCAAIASAVDVKSVGSGGIDAAAAAAKEALVDRQTWQRMHLALLFTNVYTPWLMGSSKIEQKMTTSSLFAAWPRISSPAKDDRKDLFGPLQPEMSNVRKYIQDRYGDQHQVGRLTRLFSAAHDVERGVPKEQQSKVEKDDYLSGAYVPVGSLEEILLWCTDMHAYRIDGGVIAMHLLAAHRGRAATIRLLIDKVLAERTEQAARAQETRATDERRDPALATLREWTRVLESTDKAMRSAVADAAYEDGRDNADLYMQRVTLADGALSAMNSHFEVLDEQVKSRLAEKKQRLAEAPTEAADTEFDFRTDADVARIVASARREIDQVMGFGGLGYMQHKGRLDLVNWRLGHAAAAEVHDATLRTYEVISKAVSKYHADKAQADRRWSTPESRTPAGQKLANALVLRMLPQVLIDLFPAADADAGAAGVETFVAPHLGRENVDLGGTYQLTTDHVPLYNPLYDVAFDALQTTCV